MKDYIKKRVRAEKLTDDAFEGKHPNCIYVGNTYDGYAPYEITIGERFYVMRPGGDFSTSRVKEILSVTEDAIVFKTTYSTYKLTLLDEK